MLDGCVARCVAVCGLCVAGGMEVLAVGLDVWLCVGCVFADVVGPFLNSYSFCIAMECLRGYMTNRRSLHEPREWIEHCPKSIGMYICV